MRILLLAILGIVTVAPVASAKHGWRGNRSYGYNDGYYRDGGYYRDYGAYRSLPPGIAKKGGWLPPGQAKKNGGYGWNNRYRDYRGYDDRYYDYGPSWESRRNRDYYNRRYYNPYLGNFWQRLF